jgi:hypothetical protein
VAVERGDEPVVELGHEAVAHCVILGVPTIAQHESLIDGSCVRLRGDG